MAAADAIHRTPDGLAQLLSSAARATRGRRLRPSAVGHCPLRIGGVQRVRARSRNASRRDRASPLLVHPFECQKPGRRSPHHQQRHVSRLRAAATGPATTRFSRYARNNRPDRLLSDCCKTLWLFAFLILILWNLFAGLSTCWFQGTTSGPSTRLPAHRASWCSSDRGAQHHAGLDRPHGSSAPLT